MTTDTKPQPVKPPIKSGWRGHLNGCIEDTDSHVEVSEIVLKLDRKTAWALCNLLTDSAREKACANETDQDKAMQSLGAALGRLIDHYSANNGDRKVVRP